MAEVIMENPLSPAPSLGAHYNKLLQDIQECISELKQEFEDSGGYPINDDSQTLHRFCAKLEYLLQAGLKVKTGLLGGKKDYWNYFSDCLSSNKSLNDSIRFVKSVTELKTNLGRGRAFLRFCLMHQRLADTMQQCVSNHKMTSEWFHPKAAWFDRKLVSELLNALYDLNDLQFDLSPRGYDLDASWPTFARRQFGSPFSWKPPSRAISTTSLSSIPNMENLSNLSPSPQVGPDPEIVKLQADVYDQQVKTHTAENEKLAAELKLDHSEKTKAGYESKMEELQKEVASLKEQLEESKGKCMDMEILSDKLTTQLKLKEEIWEQKEEMLKVRADEAEKLLTALKDDLQTSGRPASANEKFDMMELRGQILVQKKKNQAHELNIKSLQLELDSRDRVNAKKTELIDLLDRKLEQQKRKIDYLFTTAENVVQEKEKQSKKLASASDELIKLSKKYVDSEKMGNELRRMNKELKAMLSSIEGKGKQIAGLAKEKLKSYTEKNKKLQDEVDDLKQERSSEKDPAPLGSRIVQLEAVLSSTCSEILCQVSQLIEKENLNPQGQEELGKIQNRLKSMDETNHCLIKTLETTSIQELETLKNQLETTIAEASEENKQLVSQIEELKSKLNDQGQNGREDSSDKEALLAEINAKNSELERLRCELGAIRSLVLQSVTGVDTQQDGGSMDETDSEEDILPNLRLLLEERSLAAIASQIQDQPITGEKQGQVTSVHLENDLLKSTIDGKEIEIADLHQKLEELQGVIASKSSQMMELQNISANDVSEREELLQQIQELGIEIKEKHATLPDSFSNEAYDQICKEKDELEQKYEMMKVEITEMENNIFGLNSEVTMLRDENEALQDEKEELGIQISAQEMEKATMIQQIEHMETLIEKNVDSLEASMDDKLFELERQITAEKLEKAAALDKITELEKVKSELKAAKSELDLELERIKEEKSTLENDYSEKFVALEGLNSSLEGRMTELSSDLSGTAERKNEIEGQLEAASKELTETKEKVKELSNSLKEATEQEKTLISDMKILEEQLQNLSDEKSTLEKNHNEIITQFDEAKNSHQDIQIQLNACKQELLESKNHVDSLDSSLKLASEKESKLLEEVEKLVKENQIIQEGKSSINNEKEDLEKQIKDTEARYKELEGKHESLQVKFDQSSLHEKDLSDKCVVIEKDITKLNTTIKDMADKLEEAEKEKSELETKARDFNFQFLEIKNAVELRDHEKEDLISEIQLKDTEIKTLKAQIETQEADKRTIGSELEEARNMVKELQVESVPKVDEKSKSAETTEGETPVVEESLQKQGVVVPNVQVENINLRQQIETLLGNKDELCQKLVLEKSALQDQLNKLMTDVEEKTQAVENLEIQYQSLEESSEKTHKDSEGKSEAISTLMENMELARVEMEDLRSKLSQLNEQEVTIQDLRQEVDELKTGFSKKEQDWERERDGWEKEVSAVKFQMSAQEMEYQGIIKNLDGKVTDKTSLESQIGHQEALIETLELEIRQLRDDRETEQERGSEMHKELQKIAKENKVLSRELITTNGILQEEKREISRLKSLLETKEHDLSTFDLTHKELTSLMDKDNTDLKKKVIQLVKEKDALWQKIDKLEHQQRIRASDKWMDNSEVNQCISCRAEFSLLLRKHHCRLCGRIFCHDCCNNWVMTPHSSKKERVCGECLMSHSQLEGVSEGGSETGDSDFLDTIEIPRKRSTKWSESLDLHVPDDEDDLGFRSAASITTATDRPHSPGGSTSSPGVTTSSVEGATGSVWLDEAKLLSMTDDNKTEALAGDSGLHGPDVSPERSDAQSGRSDDTYDLITEDEVLQSMCEPLPDPNLTKHETVTLDQIESGLVVCPPELWIPAGKSYAIPIFLERLGATIHWQFSTKPKGISFSLTYRENDFVSLDQQEDLIPLCKCESHKEPVTGDITARKPGVYTLLFDNSTSRFTSKKLDFSFSVVSSERVT